LISAPGRWPVLLLLTLGSLLAPGVSFSFDPRFENLETDARMVPWHTVNRLALEAGRFPPLYRPQTGSELGRVLNLPADVTAPDDRAEADWWRARYLLAGGGRSWTGCECKTHPYSLRLKGRVIAGYTELGDNLPQEAGLAWAPGWNTSFEPVVDWSSGVFWATASGRLYGRAASAGREYQGDEALSWPGWPTASGRAQVREARLSAGNWLVDAPRFLLGAQLGNWSVTGGWAPRRTGPGLTGALTLDHGGKSFPSVTARRTSPFRWSGFMSFVAPDHLLLRAGQLSEQTVSYRDIRGTHRKAARPWFFQWLLGWDVTSWFRASVTHSVMASPREGTLWPDLLQINFPLLGTTWRELESGPVTDRVFAAQLEFRWRNAPWPVLPSNAGRLFWDYAGTDFLPSGPGGLIPEISIPASVAGMELVGPRWDLGFEYAETSHVNVLWYTNGGFSEGYSHEGWLLGHSLGGGAESFTGLVRTRPAGLAVELQLTGTWATWDQRHLPGTGHRNSLSLAVGARQGQDSGAAALAARELASGSPLLWQLTAEYVEEKAEPLAGTAESASWLRFYLKLGI
jgi:hypothetical protein